MYSIVMKFLDMFHRYPNYPVLPERTPEENEWVRLTVTLELPSVDSLFGCRLPFQIGSRVSVDAYNNFLKKNGSTGYKFHWDNGNVYIVGMASPEHEGLVMQLIYDLIIPNGGVRVNPPIDIALQSCKNSL